MKMEHVKKNLEGWRLILVPLKSMLLWDKQWYPLAIIGCVSAFYFVFWLLDLPTLTALAVTGLLINLLDFIVPKVSPYFFNPNKWTGHEEKLFEDICYSIAYKYDMISTKILAFYSLRASQPILYFGISIPMFLLLVWLTSEVNNILLFYILTTAILLWPGLQQTRFFNIFNTRDFKSE